MRKRGICCDPRSVACRATSCWLRDRHARRTSSRRWSLAHMAPGDCTWCWSATSRRSVEVFRDWSNFFVVTGGAGATLIGLLFIVVTLAGERGGRVADQGVDAFLTPTLMHFAATIMQALVMLVPWFAAWPLGVALAVLGCAGLAWQLHAFLKVRHAAFVSL